MALRTLTLPELSQRRTTLASIKSQLSKLNNEHRQITRELLTGETERDDTRQLSLLQDEPKPVVQLERLTFQSTAPWHLSTNVHLSPTVDELGLSDVARRILSSSTLNGHGEKKGCGKEDNWRTLEQIAGEIGEASTEDVFDALCELYVANIANMSASGYDVNARQYRNTWQIGGDCTPIWPERESIIKSVAGELPWSVKELISVRDLQHELLIPQHFIRLALDGLAELGAVEWIAGGIQRVARVLRVEQSIIDALRLSGGMSRRTFDWDNYDCPRELLNWSVAYLIADGLVVEQNGKLILQDPPVPLSQQAIGERVLSTIKQCWQGTAEIISKRSDLPIEAVEGALLELEANGQVVTKLHDDCITYHVVSAEKAKKPKKTDGKKVAATTPQAPKQPSTEVGTHETPNGYENPCGNDLADGWTSEPVNRDGVAAYTHLIRGDNDPERSDYHGTDMQAKWRRKLKKSNPSDWFEPILDLLKDGKPRTFNAIGVTLLDKTADILGSTPFGEALWALKDQGKVEHTTQAPILWRVRQS